MLAIIACFIIILFAIGIIGFHMNSMKKDRINYGSKKGFIIGQSGKYKGCKVEVPREGIYVGRDAQVCVIHLDNSIISRIHCKIIYIDSIEKYQIVDYSMNGTYLYNENMRIVHEKRIVPKMSVVGIANTDNTFLLI